MEKYSVIFASNHEIMQETANLMDMHGVKVIRMNYSLNGVIRETNNRKARAIFIDSTARNIEMFGIVLNSIKPQPQLFILDEGGCTYDELLNTNDKVRIFKQPTNAENIADFAEFIIEQQIADERKKLEREIEGYISSLLIEGGITPEKLGYHFLRDAINIYIRNNGAPCSLIHHIYPEISANHGVSLSSVDHGIRNSIEKSWNTCSLEYKTKYFGLIGRLRTKKPTPKEYIVTIAEQMIREMRD